MAIWAIKGYDEFYGGLHGMIEYEIFEGTEEEADARGLEMSYEVINGYTDIIDVLEEENPDLNICSLLHRKNVIITPHSAFYSQESIEKLQRISGANLGYFLAGKNEEITELVR